MMMRAMLRLVVLLFSLALVACGGGGGGSGGGAQPPATVRVAVETGAGTLGVNSLTTVAVRITRDGGGSVADGTLVTLSVQPSNLGQVGSASGENQSFGNNAVAPTTGGVAHFRFKSTTQTGTATVRASINDPNTPSLNITGQANIALDGSPSNDERLTLSFTRNTVPVNVNNIEPFAGSPFEIEVTITWRNLRGELMSPPDGIDGFGAAWSSSDNTGAIGRLDDPETDDVNEYLIMFEEVVIPINSGRGKVFVRSRDRAATGLLTVSVQDQDTGEMLSVVQEFIITSGAPQLPGVVELVPQGPASYSVGSGGPTSRQLQVFVYDGAGTEIPNPSSGASAWNNVRLEILNPQPGERLSTVNAAGSPQEGTSVSTRTFNGVAGAVFLSGTREGSITLRATADRADNNVDNGITDPIVGEAVIVVSDGRLFSVTLTTPIMESLFVNRQDLTIPGDDDELAPADGTYSLTVSAIATDRLGNPALTTDLQFGLIDAPLSGFPGQGSGSFVISGGNGDPQEGGTLFSAPGASFTTAGGGVGPGDTLVLFGKDVVGNADHEGSRIVASVNSASSLTVERRFNLNDTTGQSVNSGPVIPYVVGRATVGNIGTSARTNEIGVATVRMNYPVTQLGRRAIVWVQGNGPQVAGQPKTVGDVEHYAYFGLAPAVLSAFPSSITANQSTQVLVCLQDARNEPIQGASIGFAFENLESGTGSAAGQSGSGVVGPTGADGCVNVNVTTSGIQADQGENPRLRFFAGGADATVDIVGGEEPPPPAQTFTLTITIVGDGQVTGTLGGGGFSPPRPGNSFLCPTECVLQLTEGTNVAMFASALGGGDFVNWTGPDCSGPNAGVSVVMSQDRACTANFNP